MSYQETIAALKDFTAAQRRLDAATEAWDRNRYTLNDQFVEGKFQFCFLIKPEYIGSLAQEFLSAHNAYERLGSAHNAVIAQVMAAQYGAEVAHEITERFLERTEGGICELGG